MILREKVIVKMKVNPIFKQMGKNNKTHHFLLCFWILKTMKSNIYQIMSCQERGNKFY